MKQRIGVFLLLVTGCWAQSIPKVSPRNQDAPGRYQLFSESTMPGFIFLLDTSTGRIWKMNHLDFLPGNPLVWELQTRFDSYDAEKDWIGRQATALADFEKYAAELAAKAKQKTTTTAPASSQVPK
jgi:hypothetical protein